MCQYVLSCQHSNISKLLTHLSSFIIKYLFKWLVVSVYVCLFFPFPFKVLDN